MSLVQFEIKDRVGFIKMNRPDKRNALSPKLINKLKEAFREAKESEEVKVIVLTGNGDAFCAGADLAYLKDMQEFSYQENLEDSESLKSLFLQIYNHPKPVIAKVQGHAIAGGCGLATVCDFVYASDTVKFGYSEVRIGFIPAMVLVFLIRKIGESRASELLLSGELINAKRAYEIGLIHKICKAPSLDKEVSQFAESLVKKNSGASMKLTKKLIKHAQHLTLEKALERAAETNARARATDDCKKGVTAFLGKDPIEW